MTDADQGAGALLARVLVNRVWQHHFGEGLSRTVNDFGVRAERPSHPELLDWLAHDFVAGGWRIKRLHKLILMSLVYQQDTSFDAARAKVDPDNRLLWRRRPLRLESEILRDAVLSVSGSLNPEPFAFKQYGECGAWVCDKYSHIAKHVDDIAFVKSCFTESNDPVPALYQINTGVPRVGLPTAGAWVTYGLGSENRNLHGFIVLGGSKGIKGGSVHWSSGFLPSSYQGTLFRSQGSPILNLDRPQSVAKQDQRAVLDLVANLNREHLATHAGEPDLTARIESFELAYRMQTEATDLANISS